MTTEDGSVVVRVAQAGSELLAIDRRAEHANSEAAAEAGVGAPVVEYVEDPGLLVVGYIEGHTFTDDDLRNGGHLPRVAAACRQLHQGPRFVNEFDMFEIQPRYLAIVHEHGFRLPDRYLDFADRSQRIERAFAAPARATVPCNNDLLAGNFIDDGEKLWLIDYEYAGNNEPCFELGNLWSEANLALEQLEELMEAYDGELLRHRVARARLWGADVEVRLDPLGIDPELRQQRSTSTSGSGRWRSTTARSRSSTSPDFERLLEQATRDD